MPPSEHRLPSTVHRQLVAYFRSGWAFLIPYLAAYLLYAWLDLPVNPAGAGSIENGAGRWIPCLLHMYWLFHALHLVLGAIALRSWLRQSSLLPSPFSLLPKAAPWFFLMLLFWIPGIYLEFPADPWHHYSRTNDWLWLQHVTDHLQWKKSSYFLAYSLVGAIQPPLTQLRWFDLYYTACCLLLCWQYYRLARAIGLGERAAMIFVILQALVMGNNVFGFYRYYGMGSTLFAQLGAIAITRIMLEAMRGRPETGDRRQDEIDAIKSTPMALGWFSRLSRSSPDPASGENAESVDRAISRLPSPVSSLLQLAGFSMLLLPLIAFNHPQGLGIAGLGVGAVVVWRLIEWKRSMIGWLALAAVVASVATILWYPRHPAVDEIYRPEGWLNAWYGFNLFAPTSPVFARAAAILGLAGLVSLLAGLALLRRNHLAGWLSVFPVLALSLPFVAIPLASVLASAIQLPEGYVMAFPRFLLAVPLGLAVVVLAARAFGTRRESANGSSEPTRLNRGHGLLKLTAGILPVILLACVATPAGANYYNRFFQTLMVPPADLSMRHVLASDLAAELRARVVPGRPLRTDYEVLRQHTGVLATPGIAHVLNATGATRIWPPRRWMTWPTITPTAGFSDRSLTALQHVLPERYQSAMFTVPPVLSSAYSQVGLLSKHWLPEEVAAEHATQLELSALRPASPDSHQPQIWIQWYSPRDQTRIFARGSGQPVSSLPADRGRLDSGRGNQLILAGDKITFQPVMRNLGADGASLILNITGPEFTSRHIVTGKPNRPNPLGGIQWTYDDHTVVLTQAGRYEVELTGTTLWPETETVIRYHFVVSSPPTNPQ